MAVTTNKEFEQKSLCHLSDYVTAIAWSNQGDILAATSAAGEVVLWQDGEIKNLATTNDTSVDCAAFSHDGQFLAVGGQNGQVKIWQVQTWQQCELVTTLENAPKWVDKMVWNPKSNQLAYSLGRYLQIWDTATQSVITTLNFENSSVLSIDWRNDGKYLAVGGNQGVKIWNCEDWDAEPSFLNMPTVSLAIAWSPDGKFFASGNMDCTLSVYESSYISSEDPQPWVMKGFPGKIRQIAWSNLTNSINVPLLATSSVEGMVVWEKSKDESVGWEATVLTNHVDIIQGIDFAPNSLLLASVASDGWLCLWKSAKRVSQVLTGASGGFSCLAWHPQGKLLAAGGDQGEILIWSKVSSTKGFGKK
jgi:WD40 repeat protein